jgi:hypothetical protein
MAGNFCIYIGGIDGGKRVWIFQSFFWLQDYYGPVCFFYFLFQLNLSDNNQINIFLNIFSFDKIIFTYCDFPSSNREGTTM